MKILLAKKYLSSPTCYFPEFIPSQNNNIKIICDLELVHPLDEVVGRTRAHEDVKPDVEVLTLGLDPGQGL
jgi:hypothetical protein